MDLNLVLEDAILRNMEVVWRSMFSHAIPF